MVIWLVSILAAVIGGIPFLIMLTRSIRARQWRRLRNQLLVPTVGLGLLIGTTKLVRHLGFQQYLADLFDTKVTLGKPVFEYDSERAFNGDGYSISVHELPASVRSRFESADEGLLREFPQRPHYRGHWKSQPWRKAPFDPSLSKYLDFALMERSVAKERELEVHFTEIRKALSRNGSYYAFFYSDHPDYPGNVDFFVVDLVGGRLYVINHNT